MVEYIDIINENNEVIGKATKEEIREKRYLYRGAHLWVLNSKGEILIQKRSKTIVPYPSMLDISVGGYVSSGEDYIDAAWREIKEELGVQPKEIIEIGGYTYNSPRHYVRRVVFVCHHDGPFTLQVEEVESVRFMSLSQIKSEMKESPKKWTRGSVKSLEVLEKWMKKRE